MNYGFGKELTKENIFQLVSSYDIFKYYCDSFKEVGKSFISDIRTDDTSPSCCISQIGNDLLYTDFGLGKSYRVIDYVMKKFGLDYFEALNKINTDFNLKLGIYTENKNTNYKNITITNPKKYFTEKTFKVIKKRQREYTTKDLEYWNNFYWTKEMLVKSNTQSISSYGIDSSVWRVDENELAFSYEYYWHNGRMQRKLYFPERKNNKWISNVDNTIVQLVDVAPKLGDILFITSSKKDAGIFWRIYLDNYYPNLIIHGVAPNNEGSFVPKDWFEKIKTRWKRIIIWYNNDFTKKDNPGVKNAKRYAEKYNIEYFYNPDNTEKDPSDFSKRYGILEFKKLIDKIL